jgi:hypothetical protein
MDAVIDLIVRATSWLAKAPAHFLVDPVTRAKKYELCSTLSIVFKMDYPT